MYYHNKAQQSKNRVHISGDILYVYLFTLRVYTLIHTLSLNARPQWQFFSNNECFYIQIVRAYIMDVLRNNKSHQRILIPISAHKIRI